MLSHPPERCSFSCGPQFASVLSIAQGHPGSCVGTSGGAGPGTAACPWLLELAQARRQRPLDRVQPEQALAVMCPSRFLPGTGTRPPRGHPPRSTGDCRLMSGWRTARQPAPTRGGGVACCAPRLPAPGNKRHRPSYVVHRPREPAWARHRGCRAARASWTGPGPAWTRPRARIVSPAGARHPAQVGAGCRRGSRGPAPARKRAVALASATSGVERARQAGSGLQWHRLRSDWSAAADTGGGPLVSRSVGQPQSRPAQMPGRQAFRHPRCVEPRRPGSPWRAWRSSRGRRCRVGGP